jgi:2-phosphoglycolate phosphatase
VTLRCDAVLFDLDGTLVDSAPDLAAAANEQRASHGLPALPFERLRPRVGSGARGMVGVAFGLAPGDDGYEALRDDFLARYERRLLRETTVFARVAPVLERLEALALPWGIVTNKATRFTAPLLDALGLSARAATVVCGDTTPHAKPHPAPLLHAAAALGVLPARCLYVGDAQRDIEAGIAAGMRTIVARYGYIQPEERPDSWPADGHIADPAALIAWLPERGERAPRHGHIGTRR